MHKTISLIAVLLFAVTTSAQKTHTVKSPDNRIVTTIQLGESIHYSITHDNQLVLDTSPVSMTLSSGEVWGKNPKATKVRNRYVNETIASPFYRKENIKNEYNEAVIDFKGEWSLEFRVYNDGMAYRFVSKKKKPFTVRDEEVAYNFGKDLTAIVPYVQVGKDGDFNAQMMGSFENTYTTDNISKLNKQRLIFLPVVAEVGNGKKLLISESDLESYPGLYLTNAGKENTLSGVLAKYPKSTKQGGHNMLQFRVTEREEFIAKVDKPRTFPWRMAIISKEDKELADSDMTYKLAAPSRVADTSWIKPGKVAWDWWNNWNIDGVDFKSGVNNETYKFYIDFASANNIEYVILDEGWAVNLKADLMQVVPEIDLRELVNYAAGKGVDIILWAGYHAFNRDMENICRHYSEMGVKGFKVDFMDRDDQEMVEFNHRAAETCARYKLILDLHGMYKPAGLNRTYPNVLNFEGVHGLEQMKWSPETVDQVTYDVTIPFIRQVAGPIDYTQGAMRNASKGNYFPSNSEPMSQGTRCRQLAMYVIFESPFNMLCDAPTNYMREPESLQFIAEIPTVWDETITLEGKLGEYIVMARRSGSTWYVGGMTNWDAREVTIDLSAITKELETKYLVTQFADGANAHRSGRDYKKSSFTVTGKEKLTIHMAPGGGFAFKLSQ
ncbi:glycoside hydrolase family 97 protein [Bacteroides sp. OttesenSCG-928-M17]|nr:glycoside hydrolase family 97 protein [Bacteroides sp. OttesenSCG-928-M17]